MTKIQTLEFPNFKWIDIESPDAKTMQELGKQYGFHPLEIADTLSVSYRSKIEDHPEYTFVVLLFPLYNRQTREIESSEVNIFAGQNYLVTTHEGRLTTLKDFFHTFHISPDLRTRYEDKSPERLVYEMLDKMFLYVIPMIDHLSDDCDTIEKAIFSGKQRRMISEILMVRRNVIAFRKIMQVHKNVLKKTTFTFKENPTYVMKKTDVYFDALLDYAKEIWDTLENLKERIEALQQSNESQISFHLSDIVRTLTIITAMTFPATVIGAIFGMNAENIPIASSPYGFWYIIGVMLALLILMVVYFKKKGWLE